jgi:hypothetical protein
VHKFIEAHFDLSQILCLQEAWSMPFPFCTQEKEPWREFAEVAGLFPHRVFGHITFHLMSLGCSPA